MDPRARAGLAWVAVVIAAAISPAGAVAATPAYNPLTPAGQLVPSNTGEAFGRVVLAGGMAFAGAPDTSLSARAQGAVFAYAPPSSGWAGTADPVAVLTASHPSDGDGLGSSLQSDGQTVVVQSETGALYVFVRPSGGWAGSVHEAAILTARSGDKLSNPVLSGSTIAARGVDSNERSSVYVFSEPPGGWSGALHESAVLTESDATPESELGGFSVPGGNALAVSGSTVVAGDPSARVGSSYPGAVYVFTEPPGGWSGSLHETAKLTASDIGPSVDAPYFGSDVAVFGNEILAALPNTYPSPAEYLFTQPAGGWRSETETAKLVAAGGELDAGAGFAGSTFSVSGATIAVPGAEKTGSSTFRPAIFIYTQPPGGWSGTISESATLLSSDLGGLYSPTISGNVVVAGTVRAADAQTVVGDGPAYVFAQPSGGWSGTITETAQLTNGAGGPAGALPVFAEPTGGWSGESTSAWLVPPGSPTSVVFDDVAASGQTAAASGSGEAFVYTTPASGWPSVGPAARLIDSGGQQLGSVGVSGTTAVALTKPPPNSGEHVDVFTQPAGGWAGAVTESATLVPSDGAPLYSVAVDGPTVVALGGTWQHSAAYVFTEPPGGWTGTLHEVAKLEEPQSTLGGPISVQGTGIVLNGSISGTTVLATGTAYVFTEPAGGWSGVRSPTATLAPPGWQQGEAHIYERPPAGWAGTVPASARLLAAGPGMAISGSTVAISEVQYPTSRYDSCPCPGSVLLFSEPAGGWSGTLTSKPALTGETDYDGAMPVALDGQVLFAGAQPIPNSPDEPGLGVFRITGSILDSPFTPGPPTAHIRLSGLARGRARLTLNAQAAPYAPPIRSFSLALPPGLRFARHFRSGLGQLGQGVSVHLRRGRLVITFVRYPTLMLALHVGPRSVVERPSLRVRIRTLLRARHHHRPLTLRFIVRITDVAGAVTRLVIPVRVG